MRITCPLCGPRDRREFYYLGDRVYADRPQEDAAAGAWDSYLYLRDNPAGETRDLWFHEMGCSAWVEVTRNTETHAVLATRLVAGEGEESKPGGSPGKVLSTATPRSAFALTGRITRAFRAIRWPRRCWLRGSGWSPARSSTTVRAA